MKTPLYTPTELIERIYKSRAVSIWNNETGPMFWYAAGVPGPFYVNTEKLIGEENAQKLLTLITDICASDNPLEQKAELLTDAVMSEYADNNEFRRVVATLIEKSKLFHDRNIHFISGGERRDWFFSIPFAHETQKEHVFLFKGQTFFCREDHEILDQDSRTVLHVSDLVHNASSYFDNWIPTLEQSGFELIGAMSVINRGVAGTDRLAEYGLENTTLRGVDLDFFKDLKRDGHITEATYEEIELYFSDRERWAVQYILGNANLFGVHEIDEKSLARLKSFVANDPWGLKQESAGLFDELKNSYDFS